jgi:hypothetical protein
LATVSRLKATKLLAPAVVVIVAAVAVPPKVKPVAAVISKVVADDGATESIPKPIEATATSAMRLKVVFVDICFLSISQDQEFPDLGFELIS